MYKRLRAMMGSMIFLTAAGGLLGALSFAPFNWPLVGWLAPWPMFFLARKHRDSIKRLLWAGFLFAFFLCVFGFYWTVHLFIVFGGLPLWMALFVFIIHTLLLDLKIPLFIMIMGLLFRKRFKRLRVFLLLLVPFVGTVLDIVTPQVFSWYWGNAVAGNIFLVQVADLVGIHGITFLFFTVSYAAYRSLPLLRIGMRPSFRAGRISRMIRLLHRPAVSRRFAPVAGMLVLWMGYGVIQKYRYESMEKGLPKVRVAALQPDSPLEKYGEHQLTPEAIETIMRKTIPGMAREAYSLSGGRLDLLVLPESAVPYYTTQNDSDTRVNNLYSPTFERMVEDLARDYSVPVFFNEIGIGRHFDPRTGQVRLDAYNSAPLYGPEGKRVTTYYKRILIAFGEQIPMASFLDSTGLIMLVPESIRYSRFRPGDGFVFMPYTRDGQFLPLICYEVLDPEYVRAFVLAGRPDFMVNITQDRWYGKTIETFQHYELGRIRTVETRKALVRSTNSGTSGMVDIAGNYVKPAVGPVFTAQEEKAIQIFDVPVNRQEPTVFVRFGNLWLVFPAAVWLLTWIVAMRRR